MNPVVTAPAELSGLALMAWTWTTSFAPRLLAAVVILALGLFLAGWTRRAVDRLTRRSRWVDQTVRPFLLGVIQYAIVILVLLLVLSQVGIETSSLLAVVGAAGLAVGLALQGTLSNIAAGIMLLWLRPFEVGDYVEVNGIAGTVEETGLFACALRTFDGARLFAPNATIWNFSLRNHSRAASRMIAVGVTIGAEVAWETASAALCAGVAADPRVAKDPAPVVFVESLTASSTVLLCRIWVANAGYSAVQRDIAVLLARSLAGAGIGSAAVQLVGRTVPVAGDQTRLLEL